MSPSACSTDSLGFADQRDLVEQHHKIFASLVTSTEQLLRKNRFQQACLVAEVAAYFAATHHCGIFASPRLESALRRIGQAVIRRSGVPGQLPPFPQHVLHVLTEAHAIGGSTRCVWRWMRQDGERKHSVAVTNQKSHPLPRQLCDVAKRTGGSVEILDRGPRDAIARAQRLWELAREVDLVILHTHSRDIVPMLAFADPDATPAVVHLDLADHIFWLNVSISNLICPMREAAGLMARRRRGVDAEKCKLVPIPLEPISRSLSRSEAKTRIGIDQDQLVLLTVATAYKYVPRQPPSLVEAIAPVLDKHRNAVLIAIGPSNTKEWEDVSKRTQGRVIALGARSDTTFYYQAADIYLDSFPFASNTSMLEAGSYATPIVSYSPYREHARVFGPGCPGLEDVILKIEDLEEYTNRVDTLLSDAELRARIGAETRTKIAAEHIGRGWLERIHTVYSAALSSERIEFQDNSTLDTNIEIVDLAACWILHQAGYISLNFIIEEVARSVGLARRLPLLWEVRLASGALPKGAVLPVCFNRAIKPLLSRLR